MSPAVTDPTPGVGIAVGQARRAIHWGQWVARLAILLCAAWVAYFLTTSPNFQWDVVFAWFTAPTIVRALWTTIWLAAVSMLIGIVIGVLLAVTKMSGNRLLGSAASGYIWFFRGTPLLVQLIFWYNLAVLAPTVSFGVPLGGPKLWEVSTNSLITPLSAAILGLALNEGAYMAEVVRGGLLAVDRGQSEAATAFGMTRAQTLRRVVLPQAMRAIIPPTGNQLISIVKATSQVSVIAMSDLLYTVQTVYNQTFQTIPLLLVAVMWYLVVTSILNIAQSFIEDHFARGHRDDTGLPGLVRRIRRRAARRSAVLAASASGGAAQRSQA